MSSESQRNEWQRAGLYDPAADDAEAQLALLSHLSDQGATFEQLLEAHRASNLPALAADLALSARRPRSGVEEVAAACGVTPEHVIRIRLASGLPLDPSGGLPASVREDVTGFDLGAAFFGEESVLAFTRVMGGAAAHVAEAALSLFLSEVEAGLDESGADVMERVTAGEEAAGLLDVVTAIMGHLVREHLELAVRRQRSAAGGAERTVLTLAVGFVDLTGSTEWARQLSPREQAEALALFESAAWDTAIEQGGRIVKLIGDEAMFVTAAPDAACRVALRLCRRVGDESRLPAARGAVGFGEVAMRGGDYYGSLVNTVARAVKAAPQAGVVATERVQESCQGVGGLSFLDLGRADLRGIDEPVRLFQVASE